MSYPETPATFQRVRILVVSALYPPVAFGGYEVECSGVVERLRERHEVLVLTSRAPAGGIGGVEDGACVRRELTRLTQDARGAVRAPFASVDAARAARRALAWGPEMIYVWNGASIPQSSLRVLADGGVPLAFRVCEHWFGGLFTTDQYMRELLPADRGPARGAWAAGARALNRLPSMRLRPTNPLRAAISWNSEAIRRMVELPDFVHTELERVGHSVPRHGEIYERVRREPAEVPEVVFLGRVTQYKGLAVAVEALALLASEHGLQARLVVVGPEDPAYGAQMRELAARLGVAERVSWRGQASPEQAAAELAHAHALIVPSLWEEPFPLVTIEGAFARVPLVASDVGGIGEGMHDEEHALLFARGDARAAAAALARTLREPEQTAARVQRAHTRAQAFTLGPYLEAQERFVLDAHAALLSAAGRFPRSVPDRRGAASAC
jgi:glycosyltransferase involved in cell wall biosynthesis